MVPATEVAIWERLLVPEEDELSPEKARLILQARFPDKDVQRMHELSAKARAGTLTPEENAEMDMYEYIGYIVSSLKSRARQVLKTKRSS